MVDVQALDFFDRRFADGPGDGARFDRLGEFDAQRRLDALGVVESRQHQRSGEHDAGCDDRTGQWAASDFVDAADRAKTALQRRALVRMQAHEAATLAFAGEPAFARRLGGVHGAVSSVRWPKRPSL